MLKTPALLYLTRITRIFEKKSAVQKLLCISLLILSFSAVSAQDQESVTKAGYLKFPTIPPFTLIGIDSTKFTRDKLAKHKKTMIMIFSPGCDHCRHQTDSMLANIDQLRDVQILMSTYQPFTRNLQKK